MRPLVDQFLLQKTLGDGLFRMICMNENIVVSTPERLIPFMDPDRLDIWFEEGLAIGR